MWSENKHILLLNIIVLTSQPIPLQEGPIDPYTVRDPTCSL